MSKFEPFWDPEKERWPGTYNMDGTLRKGDVVYDTHVGNWCDWDDVSGLGVIATSEFRFGDDGRFVWLRLSQVQGQDIMVRREGSWELQDDVLLLRIASTEDPDCMPRERMDLKIYDRHGRLALQTVRLDELLGERSSYSLLPARAGDSVRVLEAALEKKRRPHGALPPPFSTLEPLLKLTIPAAIKKLKLSEPIFCIRLYYYDTHAPREGYGIAVRILTEPLRQKLATQHSELAHLEEELWLPQSGAANGRPGRDPGLYAIDLSQSRELTKLFGDVYDLLCESEEDHMPHLRELVRRTSKALNARAWAPAVPVTDDLVIFPADGSGSFGGDFEYLDDLQAAVPPERIELLRQRGYFA